MSEISKEEAATVVQIACDRAMYSGDHYILIRAVHDKDGYSPIIEELSSEQTEAVRHYLGKS